MVSFSFDENTTYFGYGEGVNASNLTMADIKAANARLSPIRLARIKAGLLKMTRHDPGYEEDKQASTAPNYVKWNKYELLQSIVARRLKSRASLKAMELTRANIIAVLKKADKTPRFERFLELPAEIRCQIYELALDTSKPRTRPCSPPLSLMNGLIRQETLPIFFRNVTMNAHVHIGQGTIGGLRRKADMSDAYLRYFEFANIVGWAQHMRNFQWYVSCHDSRSVTAPEELLTEKWLVEFSEDMQTVKVSGGNKAFPLFANRRSIIRTEMASLLNPGTLSMTDDSFNRMVAFFHNFCEQEGLTYS